MCRGKDHGNRRCPHDTSEARKRRRRAAQGRELYKQDITTDPKKYNAVIADTEPRSIKELRKEAQLIGALLHAPAHKDPAVQAEIDTKNELLVTRLGHSLGMEAERRAGFDRAVFAEEMDTMPEAYMKAASAVGAARRKREQAKADLDAAINAEDTESVEEKDGEIQRLQEFYDVAIQEHTDLQKPFIVEGDLDIERREKLQKEALAKILPAYKSVIADIRPVGGIIDNHELSSDDAVETMQRTVGKHYPSAWIEASKAKAPVAIVSDDNVRSFYNANRKFPGVKVPGMETTPEYFVQSIIDESESEEAYNKLSEGNPGSVQMNGKPLDLEGSFQPYRHISFPVRRRFNPRLDTMGENGEPVGNGWKHGYVLDPTKDNFALSENKAWYRDETDMVPAMRSITIPAATTPEADGHAYHEAVHSFEDSVGDGRMMGRMQEAFLKRRSTVDGVQSPLKNIAATNNLIEMEFSRTKAGLIHSYMGREYPDQVVHREVLATGAETLFEGRYGAFMSLRRLYREDLDHRAFTMGMFATA